MCKTAKIDPCKKCGQEEKMVNGVKKCVPSKNMYLCVCGETAFLGNKVMGICTRPNFCDTKTAPDQHGGSGGLGNMGDFMKSLGQVADLAGKALGLMQAAKGAGGGSGSGAGTGAGTGNGYNGCVSYYQTNNASNTDPCAYYVPATSDSIYTETGAEIDSAGASKGLLDSLFGDTSGGETFTDVPGETAAEGADTEGADETKGPAIGQFQGTGVAGLEPGVRGDIRVIPGGITVLVGNRDVEQNKAVAGFYGSQVTQAQQTGIVATWCQTRPWATNFLRYIVPATFFDSLCSVRGYKVGATPAATSGKTQVSVTQTKAAATKSFTAELPKAAVEKEVAEVTDAKVEIWAVPDKVSLGSRTTVFWNAKGGISTCEVTSPDGSFKHETLSGGAATVPLTQATTYSISCIKKDGKPITGYVTVQLRN